MKFISKLGWFLGLFLSLCSIASQAHAESLSGHVREEGGAPLGGVAVAIPAIKRGAVTDDSGNFLIENITHGIYTATFTLIGYSPATRSVHVHDEPVNVDVTLSLHVLEGDVVTVTGSAQATSQQRSIRPISTVEGRDLDRQRGAAVLNAIESSPGVSLYTTGQGIAKPVVRGLTSQRVLVLADGVRQEGQQWGDEHAPELGSMQAEKIEVVRGPASVLYGSDALGGVVNVIAKEAPSAETGAPALRGELAGQAFNNGPGGGGTVSLEGAKSSVGYRGMLNVRHAGDVRTPGETLFNSGADEVSGMGILGWSGKKGNGSVDYSRFQEELQMHEDPTEDPTATPFQKVHHQRIHATGMVPVGRFRMEADGAWQENWRREFEAEGDTDPALDLLLRTSTLNLKVHHHPGERITGTAGGYIASQNNQSRAEEKLIPDYDLTDAAAYLYEAATVNTFSLSAGVRYDHRSLDITESTDLGVPAQTRDYSAVTANGGVSWNFTPSFVAVGSIGRGYRAPTPYELFVNGVHEGTIRYDVGDSTLDPEVSLNVDLGLRFKSKQARFELAAYRNSISQFIYLSPTGQVDSASGFDIYNTHQADAVLTGMEFTGDWQVLPHLLVRGGVNLIHGQNNELDSPLPLMPASNARLGAEVSADKLGALLAPYVSADVKMVDEQNRIEIYETVTPGYVLLDLGAGFEVPLTSGRMRLDLRVENALDQAYRDHLSRFKDFALNPGRGMSLKLVVPFSLVS